MSQRATFGAGCFWGVEARFARVDGVLETVVGYCGGSTSDPSYEQVCSGRTGHAEVVMLRYDPAVLRYEALLEVFFEAHDPTTRDRQGADVGTQYRSVVFFHTPEQDAAAREARDKLAASGHFRDPIVTEIVPVQPFYRAEEYHQRYLEKRGQGSCRIR